jgi:hypothetical protein
MITGEAAEDAENSFGKLFPAFSTCPAVHL